MAAHGYVRLTFDGDFLWCLWTRELSSVCLAIRSGACLDHLLALELHAICHWRRPAKDAEDMEIFVARDCFGRWNPRSI